MTAAAASMEASAGNIANLATRGFRRESVTQSTGVHGGVSASPTLTDRMGSEPAEDIVGLLQSKNAFLMNLAVFKTANAMTGSLLDITQ